METETFHLEDNDYIELSKLLKLCVVVPSGGHAKQLIANNQVLVNQQPETRKKCKITADMVIEIPSLNQKIIVKK
ncbi:RNA-binding protein [Candidatus Marinamargulisbacteria bacterium SCGC AG-410-N11]|nr:RNA-binding protein [Candidatus Marinamargulisbacteria bacterium SCGC AG-410-N11]